MPPKAVLVMILKFVRGTAEIAQSPRNAKSRLNWQIPHCQRSPFDTLSDCFITQRNRGS